MTSCLLLAAGVDHQMRIRITSDGMITKPGECCYSTWTNRQKKFKFDELPNSTLATLLVAAVSFLGTKSSRFPLNGLGVHVPSGGKHEILSFWRVSEGVYNINPSPRVI